MEPSSLAATYEMGLLLEAGRKDLEIVRGYALCLGRMKREDEGEEWLQKALEINPRDDTALQHMASRRVNQVKSRLKCLSVQSRCAIDLSVCLGKSFEVLLSSLSRIF